jgi:hypothetical protein
MRRWAFVVLPLANAVASSACGGGAGGATAADADAGGSAVGGIAGGGGDTGGTRGAQSTPGGADPGAAGAGSAGGDPAVTPSYGRFGVPETTFTLPEPTAADGEAPALYYPDLAGSFPDVDWDALDRLYLPTGVYRSVLLGGLPARTPERPLVITNLGGQVQVGGLAANYVFVIHGGSNWILTGRYDPVSQTGDAGFRGHAEGAFAHSQGTYGLSIDDGFSKEGLSGLAIGDRATAFELDCIEIARVDFAGITAKTDDDGTATMRDVRVHDVYVHDTGSEGIYFGSTQAQPQHSFERLEIYDNRLLRTGTEALQVGQLGADCEVHHNVIGPAAVRWRSAFQQYQDGNVQWGQRYGSASFHHNVVIGTGDLFVELFPTVVGGDPRSDGDTVAFTDNYFADTSASGVYTHADDTGVTIRFERNTFRGFYFDYDEVYPDVAPPVQVFGVGSNSPDPHVLSDNIVDGPYPFLFYTFPSVTESNNVSAAVPRVVFRDFMGAELDDDYRKLEWWTDRVTLGPTGADRVYPAGAFVVHQGTLYRALRENQARPPDSNAEDWSPLPPPADDVRLASGSPHPGLGLRWPPP